MDLLESEAKGKLSECVCVFIAHGVGEQWTLRENRRAFDDYAFAPHRMGGIVRDTVDTSVTILGKRFPHPVMDLVGWTNDRLVADRIARLPQTEWVYGVPNASIVMAAFLHVAPGGMRFNGPDLGAWYAADDLRTAAAEVGHHLRRETVARNVTRMTRTYRAYAATLLGDYLDIRGQQTKRSEVYASNRYNASQKLGEEVRASGGAGLLYDSLRRRTGVNVVAHRPRNISDIVQTDHFEITVLATSRTIDVRKLSL